ncbi:phosphodiesterase [Candidatus Magnetaquicoccus inordinatus]|uniref:phosphodiesterase n=1 Tax=Candidatus Magnetaquicoccus inordinatus TaxID=2496818 RepID=UPI00102B281B|nr:phosphodiesterase [Candidatus Magnetaquicoccus inordinatus]
MLSVLQFSDCHLLADPQERLYGADPEQCLQQVLQAAQPWAARSHMAIISGDLTQHGEAAAYQQLNTMFSALGCPVYSVPGNHDCPETMEKLFNGTALHWQPSLTLQGWHFLFLNAVLPKQDAGEVSAAQLEHLQQQLEQLPPLPTALVLHHHPRPTDSSWMEQMALRNSEELFTLLAGYPQVALILFGHIHQPFDTLYRSIRLLGTPSTCVQFAHGTSKPEFIHDRFAFRWLHLHADGTIETDLVWITPQKAL